VTTIVEKVLRRPIPGNALVSGSHRHGQKYWAALELMGRDAAANHTVIHRHVVRELGAGALLDVRNHHLEAETA